MNMVYESSNVAVDAVIFTIKDKALKLLLHTREKEPFKGSKELYGGLLLPDETAEQTLKRKLSEINCENSFLKQFFTFTKRDRDPRQRTISIGFIALLNEEKASQLTGWYNYSNLPEMAFDHKEIIIKARKHLKENMSTETVKQFMPKEFPLNKLQHVYEIIEEKDYDNRNFRKKLFASGIVNETGRRELNVSHRPAKLFKFEK